MKLLLDEDITAAEIECLRQACLERVNQGITLSLRFLSDQWLVETDGIHGIARRELHEARNRIYSIVRDADALLSDLIFGHEMRTLEKTTSPVSTYQNPFDVLIGLLEKGENREVRDDLQTFADINPYPKLRINPDAYYEVLNSGNAVVLRKGLAIDVRGQYTDAYGNFYSDDSGACCHGNKPFRQDFAANYDEYLRRYGVLRRLDAYAAVVGLILKTPKGLNVCSSERPELLDDFVRFTETKTPKSLSDHVNRDMRHLLMLQESLATEISDPAYRNFMYKCLAERWQAHDPLHAKELLVDVLRECDGIPFSDELLRDKLAVETSCMLLDHVTNNRLSEEDMLLLAGLFGATQSDDMLQHHFADGDDNAELLLAVRMCYVMLPVALRREFWQRCLDLGWWTLQATLKLIVQAGHEPESVLAGQLWQEAFCEPMNGLNTKEKSLMDSVIQAKPIFVGMGARRTGVSYQKLVQRIEQLPTGKDLEPSDELHRMMVLALAYFAAAELALRSNNWRTGLCDSIVFHMRSCSIALHLQTERSESLRWLSLATKSAKSAYSAIESLNEKRARETVADNMEKIKEHYVRGENSTELMKVANTTKYMAETLGNYELSRRISLIVAMHYSLAGDYDNAARWKRIAETVQTCA